MKVSHDDLSNHMDQSAILEKKNCTYKHSTLPLSCCRAIFSQIALSCMRLAILINLLKSAYSAYFRTYSNKLEIRLRAGPGALARVGLGEGVSAI